MIMKAFDFRNLPVDDCEITYSNLYNNIEFFVFFPTNLKGQNSTF